MKQSDKKINLAVIFGGNSVEHEVSVQSAENVINSIKDDKKINLIRIFVDKDGKWHITDRNFKKTGRVIYDFSNKTLYSNNKKIKVDVFFPLIHGNIGEDGKIQGFFEITDTAYIGCDLLSSAITMNKKFTKTIAKLNGIPVLRDIILHKYQLKEISKIIKKIKLPVFVKPVSLGSSIGVSKAETRNELLKAITNAFEYENQIMIEEAVENSREIVCGVIGNSPDIKCSECGEIVIKGNHEFYDYNAKYVDDNGMELIIPAKIDNHFSDKIKNFSKIIFEKINGYGYARVDFLMNMKTKQFFLCEVNTIPGFTSHSLFPRLWNYSGIKLNKLIHILIKLALKRKKEIDKLKKVI